MKKLDKLTQQDKDLLLSKTAYTLPENPSDKQMSASQIKKKLYEGFLVLFEHINNMIDAINDNVDLDTESITTINTAISVLNSYFNNGKAIKAVGDESGNNIKQNYGAVIDFSKSINADTFYLIMQLINKSNQSISTQTVQIPTANNLQAGLMSRSDKLKLDTLADPDAYPTENSMNTVRSGGVFEKLQRIIEILNGMFKTAVLSYTKTTTYPEAFYDIDGNLHPYTDFADFVDGYTAGNPLFDTQASTINNIGHGTGWLGTKYYFIFDSISDGVERNGRAIVVKSDEMSKLFGTGDNIIVREIYDSNGDKLPDRWIDKLSNSVSACELETAKVDLTNYFTITQTINAILENQYGFSLIIDALTNINGRELTAYEETDGSTVIGTTTYYYKAITKSGSALTSTEAMDYMEYMCGSRHLPVDNYEKPRTCVWIMADGSFWKPQFDDDGMKLWSLPNPFVCKNELKTVNGHTLNSSGNLNIDEIEVGTTAPSSNNSSGLTKIVYLTTDPETKYSGYLYLIKEEE